MTGAYIESGFDDDYFAARDRFLAAAHAAGARVQTRRIEAAGPDGRPLYIDAAYRGAKRPRRLLIVISGTHGIEGFAGSAVQRRCLLRPVASGSTTTYGELWIHALNPYGFAWLRRTNEHNVDLNRNGLESFPGPPNPDYRALDALLNPPTPPGRVDGFTVRLLWEALRRGPARLIQAIAGGQYEFPRGLFYGGERREPSVAFYEALIADRAFDAAEFVVQLDLHTGLGRWGGCEVLVDPQAPPPPRLARRLAPWLESRARAYAARGSLGELLRRRFGGACVPLVVEFGTYSMLHVLAALREENRAHFCPSAQRPARARAKSRLLEAARPADARWQARVSAAGTALLDALRAYPMSGAGD